MPFSDRPAGQLVTQVAVVGTKYWPAGQVTQVLAAPAQVRQLDEHGWHTLLGPTKVPAGHCATHAPPLR